MKKIYWLMITTIGTLWSQEVGGVVGGSCDYMDFIATAQIVSTDGKVKYKFSERSVLPRHLNSHTTYSVTKNNISKEYASHNSLTVGSLHNIKISEIRGGTCTPTIIEFVDIDSASQENYRKDSQTKLDNSWKEFSKLEYKNSDYSIRKDVDYFELRKYLFDVRTDKQVTKKYIPYLSIYRKKLSTYPLKIISKFQNIPFDNTQFTDIPTANLESPYYRFKVKGFIIKKDKIFWTINEKKDIVWLFDGIDTEAELYQFLVIHNLYLYGNGINSYKKNSNSYDVKQTKIEHHVDKKSKGKFDEYTEYEIHSTHIYHIKSNGEFTKKFVSTEKKNEKKSLFAVGFHGDPPILPHVSLEEILKDKNFITPL